MVLFKKKARGLCDGCTICCRYVAIEFDKPTCKEDYHHIFWFLAHKDVEIFVDHDNGWCVEFKTKCRHLDRRGMCSIYENRPKICRDYSHEECEKHGEGKAEKERFKTREDFIKYLRKKGINYQFKEFEV